MPNNFVNNMNRMGPPRAARQIPWGWIIIAVVIIGIILAVVLGVVKVGVKNCSGGQPGIGKDKDSGCFCSRGDECKSGTCNTSVVASASDTGATGRCA